MSRKVTMGGDWNAMRPRLGHSFELWSRFPAEIAPDLIVSPLLFGTSRAKQRGRAHACTLEPRGLLVLHGRGREHVDTLLEHVAPKLGRVPFAFVLDADAARLHPADRPSSWMPVSHLPAILRQIVIGFAPDDYVDVIDEVCREQREAFARLPAPDLVDEFLALPEVAERKADAAARAERAPLRLWEAMLWRGENYRWELVDGEVPLVGELFSPLAANRTFVTCIRDAERAFGVAADERGGWVVCGPMRPGRTRCRASSACSSPAVGAARRR
jgi:hypothetical protein